MRLACLTTSAAELLSSAITDSESAMEVSLDIVRSTSGWSPSWFELVGELDDGVKVRG